MQHKYDLNVEKQGNGYDQNQFNNKGQFFW